MSDGWGRHRDDVDARVGRGASVDELLDRAVAAINCGDRVAAAALAGQVLAADEGNADAEDLLTVPGSGGEIRRLTILFADVVDSTVLSTQVEPETYHLLVGRYREQVLSIVARYEGHISSTKGDGLLAVFGHPRAHEDDVRRAVLAGLEITREVARLSAQAQRRFGIDISVRVGVHRGLVYLDTEQDDVYGLAANLAARVSGMAEPGTVVVSDAVELLVRNTFELASRPPTAVKGVKELIAHHRVLGERSRPVRATRGPLVGRDRETARLEKAWARAQAGTLNTAGLVFRGEPGIGKSRLAAAATELAGDSGAVVVELIGSALHTDAGLHPVRNLLERRCGLSRAAEPGERLRLLEAELRALALDPVTSLPLLAPVLGVAAEHGYQPVQAEGRKLYELIGDALQQYLLACFGDHPGLLVAEDLHWFDPSTLETLGALLQAARGQLMVVATGRPGDWLPADWPVKVLDLTALTGEQTDTLVVALNPTATAAQRVEVAARCDGVPFYIEQVVAGLGETGVPEGLYEPLFARLRATTNATPVLEAAAVIGRQVDHGLLGAVLTLDEAEVDDVLDELEDAFVLEPWGTDNWRFRHELLREVAYELAPPSVTRGLHAKVADALIGQGGDPDWPLVAGHYDRAEQFGEAASAYQQAATEARTRGALAEARGHLTQALAQLDRTTPGRERDRREITLRLQRGILAGAADSPTSRAVADDFERCLQLAGTDLRDDELLATLTSLVPYYEARADLLRAGQVIESLRAGLGEGRHWFRPVIDTLLGVLAWLRGDFEAARRHLEHATAGAAAADHRIEALWFMPAEPISGAHLHLALTHLLHGELAPAEATLAHAERLADQLSFPQGPYMLGYARWLESWTCIEAGQLDQGAVLAADMTDLGERHGFDIIQLLGATQQATVNGLAALDAGSLDETALEAHATTISTLLDTWRAVGFNLYRTFFDAVVGRLLLAAGQPEQARDHLDTALALAEDTGMRFYDAELLRLRAQTHRDPDARRADVAAALDLARRQGATLFELRAALDDFELRDEPARDALIDVVNRFPDDNAWPELARARAALQ